MIAANLIAIVATLVTATAFVIIRIAVQVVPPLTIGFLRVGLAGLILGLLVACLRGLKRPHLSDWRSFLGLGLSGGLFIALGNSLGLRWTEASRAGLMTATIPVWSALLSRALGEERLSPRQYLGVAVSFGGVAFLLVDRGLRYQGWSRALVGDLLIVLSSLSMAAWAILSRRAYRRYHPVVVAWMTQLVGALLLGPFVFILERPLDVRWAPKTVALVLAIGVSVAIMSVAWNVSLKRLTPTSSLIYMNLVQPSVLLLSAFVLHEAIDRGLIASMVVVTIGVVLVNVRRSPSVGVPPR
jgi:drug/metabolite transporter (DMT)-like permease